MFVFDPDRETTLRILQEHIQSLPNVEPPALDKWTDCLDILPQKFGYTSIVEYLMKRHVNAQIIDLCCTDLFIEIRATQVDNLGVYSQNLAPRRTPVVNTFGHRSSTPSDTGRQHFRTPVVNTFGHRLSTLLDIGRQHLRTSVVNTFGHRSSTLSDIGRQHLRTSVVNAFGHRSSTPSDIGRQHLRTSVVNTFGHRSSTPSDTGRQHFRTSVVNTFGHRSSTLSDTGRQHFRTPVVNTFRHRSSTPSDSSGLRHRCVNFGRQSASPSDSCRTTPSLRELRTPVVASPSDYAIVA